MSDAPKKSKPSVVPRPLEADSTGRDLLATTDALPSAPSSDTAPSFETRLAPGDKSGGYTIEAVISEGTFGIVYRASQSAQDRKVALKVAKSSTCRDQELLRRFLEEADTLTKIEHPGIVPVYASGEWQPGVPFVAMQLLQTDSLQTVLARGAVPWQRATELGIAIADALSHAHEKGVVHRDLKPANILLDDDDHLRLADFGLALHYDKQLDHENELAGTVAYMSPEQIRREAHWLDGRTDIWSLGVILYEMVLRRHPFRSDNRIKLAEEILSREPWSIRQIDPTIPADFERIVTKCLRKEVADRYSSATDLANSLRGLLQSEQRLSPRRSHTNWRVAVGVAVVFALLLVLANFFWGDFSPQAHQTSSPGADSDVANASPQQASVLPQEAASTGATTQPAAGSPLPTSDDPAHLAGTIDLFVWDTDNIERRGIGIREPNGLPLQKGDQIRLHVSLNEPAYLYLFWIDSEGETLPVYPWTPGDWSDRPTNEQPVRTLSLPESSDHGWPLEGAAGMETLVVLARKAMLPAHVDLKPRFDSLPLQAAQDPRTIVWFHAGSLVTAKHDQVRGPSFFDERKLDDPLLTTHRILHDRLHEDFELVDGVSFAKHTD